MVACQRLQIGPPPARASRAAEARAAREPPRPLAARPRGPPRPGLVADARRIASSAPSVPHRRRTAHRLSARPSGRVRIAHCRAQTTARVCAVKGAVARLSSKKPAACDPRRRAPPSQRWRRPRPVGSLASEARAAPAPAAPDPMACTPPGTGRPASLARRWLADSRVSETRPCASPPQTDDARLRHGSA